MDNYLIGEFLLLGTGETPEDGVIGVSTLLEAANIICGENE